jgi:toxin ParE1/3/4
MRLELSRRAQADLDEVRHYSLAEFGVASAAASLDAMEGAFRRMLDLPDIGTVHSTVRPPTRALGCQQHRNQVRGDTILVVRILHKAMDVERHL